MRLNLTRVCSSCRDDPDDSLPLCVDDNKESSLDLAVVNNQRFAVGEPEIGLSERCRVREGSGGEFKVKATVSVGLLTFVLISLKLQLLQGWGAS